MIVRKLRLQRGWSQEQLAQLTGLSVRTIQRIERGQNPGLESLNALAAVFEVPLSQLQTESDMPTHTSDSQPTADDAVSRDAGLSPQEQQVMEQVRDIKGFYSHCIKYVLIISLLFVINLSTSPGYIWAWWPMLGWGVGLACHGLNVFEVFQFFGPAWEKRQIEKRLGRKL
ncbi:XRE family transcriptional regulator [Pokkaliibacter plantistimulans]|uniref:XRE family transcriptional regulator n=1 Tax=Pokkaliibacter plantistimulans TaxID=1635171 RepID=A0ABX5M444_9GAMM|nr:XRE family transcriptional regulator [Pokkaliibacter plantistimulans]